MERGAWSTQSVNHSDFFTNSNVLAPFLLLLLIKAREHHYLKPCFLCGGVIKLVLRVGGKGKQVPTVFFFFFRRIEHKKG